MHRSAAYALVAALLLCIVGSHATWVANPATWALAHPNCGAALQQSPVDIADSAVDPAPQAFLNVWMPPSDQGFILPITTTTTQVVIDATSRNIRIQSSMLPQEMKVETIKVLAPAEHKVNGVAASAELQFELVGPTATPSSAPPRAFLAVLFQENAETHAASLLERLAETITTSSIELLANENTKLWSDIPRVSQEFFEYTGSATTPPCAKAKWLVTRRALPVYPSALRQVLNAIPTDNGVSARPTQMRSGRRIRSRVVVTSPVQNEFAALRAVSNNGDGGNASATRRPVVIDAGEEDAKGGYIAAVVILAITSVSLMLSSAMLGASNRRFVAHLESGTGEGSESQEFDEIGGEEGEEGEEEESEESEEH